MMIIVPSYDLTDTKVRQSLRDLRRYTKPNFTGEILNGYRVAFVTSDMSFWLSLWDAEGQPVAYAQGWIDLHHGDQYIVVRSVGSIVRGGSLGLAMHEFLSKKFALPMMSANHLTPLGLNLWQRLAGKYPVWYANGFCIRVVDQNDCVFMTRDEMPGRLILHPITHASS